MPEEHGHEDRDQPLGQRLLPGQVRQECRDLSPEEALRRPVHMRVARECSSEALIYDLLATVDGREVARRRVHPAGLRADRPLTVEEDLSITPGEHRLKVTFAPVDPTTGGKTLTIERGLRFEPGRVVLVTTRDDELVVLR